MRINFTFRNLESSDGIKAYASEKVAKLQKYLRAPIDAEVTCSMERHNQQVDVSIVSGGRRYSASEVSDDMYASIDLVMDKIDRQVRDDKGAAVGRKRHASAEILAAGGGKSS
ncbi:MAG: ribosome-associated translation inhibitor RaiA [Myxococcales bacterium]|jgi:putative sigma-54 modulation protein|nr:ribosome-associated translation inhibitor RaiA [Myxococcales bacterium]